MTKPLNPSVRLQNMAKRMSKTLPYCNGIFTFSYSPVYNIVAFTNDGFLTIKCVISNDGKKLQVVKCPGFTMMLEGKLKTPKEKSRYITVNDSMFNGGNQISWRKLESLCKNNALGWKLDSVYNYGRTYIKVEVIK